jgi:deoxyribonuclease V
MRTIPRHAWTVDIAGAKAIQLELAAAVSCTGAVTGVRFIAGVDISVNRFKASGTAAVVVLAYPSLDIVEVQTVQDNITFPYVPGLLSFREMPLIIPAFEKLTISPDLVIMDGQGIAHPRRIGIASHLGLFLGIPVIGCAKSRLTGEHNEPGLGPGSRSLLIDKREVVGAVLRTKAHVKPVYVSTGHMIDLESAVSWIMASCRGYRLPEPTRLAHLAAGGNLTIF